MRFKLCRVLRGFGALRALGFRVGDSVRAWVWVCGLGLELLGFGAQWCRKKVKKVGTCWNVQVGLGHPQMNSQHRHTSLQC